jgi:hypothetical protein
MFLQQSMDVQGEQSQNLASVVEAFKIDDHTVAPK